MRKKRICQCCGELKEIVSRGNCDACRTHLKRKANPTIARRDNDAAAECVFKSITMARYELIEKLGSKCSECEISNPILLNIHHKDINRNNNVTGNLELLCYNCHHLRHIIHQFNKKNLERLVKRFNIKDKRVILALKEVGIKSLLSNKNHRGRKRKNTRSYSNSGGGVA